MKQKEIKLDLDESAKKAEEELLKNFGKNKKPIENSDSLLVEEKTEETDKKFGEAEKVDKANDAKKAKEVLDWAESGEVVEKVDSTSSPQADSTSSPQEKKPAENKESEDKFSNKEVWNGVDEAEKEDDIEKEEKIKAELDELRNQYVKANNSATEKIGFIKRILGKSVITDKGDLESVNAAFGKYNAKKIELLDFQVQELKNGNLSEDELRKEMGELAKFFNKDEWLNIIKANDEYKLNKLEGKSELRNKAVNSLKDTVNWYRKLSWKYKVGASAIFLGLGVAGVASGTGLLAGGISATALIRKILSSAATGVGTTAMLEGLYRKKENKNIDIKNERIMENYEKSQEGNEERIEKLINILKEEMDGFQQNLKNENDKARARLVLGSAVGIGIFAVSNVGHFMGGQADVPENIEHDLDSMTADEIRISGDVPLVPDEGVDSATEVIEETTKGATESAVDLAKEDITEKTVSTFGKILEVKQGSSFEGTLIQHLKGLGMRSAEAGKQAHLMALDYAKEHGISDKGPYSLIHKGARLVMSEDGKSILGIEGDNKLGWIKPEGGFEIEKDIPRAGIGEATKEAIENISTEDVVEKIGETSKEAVENISTDDAVEKVGEASKEAIENASVSDVADNPEVPAEDASNISPENTDTDNVGEPEDTSEGDSEKKPENINNSENSPEFIAKALEKEGVETMKKVSLGDRANWAAMKNMTYNELKGSRGMSAKVINSIDREAARYVREIGREANFREGERLINWVGRVARRKILS